MTDNDTAAVLAYFASAWPNYDLTEPTVRVWQQECADLDPLDAEQAMRQLVRSEQFFPTIAKFRQQVRTLAYDRRHRQVATAIGSGAPQPWPSELVASIKATIASNGTRRHWHGGPNPCPVCGGIAPASLDASAQRGTNP